MERYLDHFREEHIEILQSKVLFRGMNRDEIRSFIVHANPVYVELYEGQRMRLDREFSHMIGLVITGVTHIYSVGYDGTRTLLRSLEDGETSGLLCSMLDYQNSLVEFVASSRELCRCTISCSAQDPRQPDRGSEEPLLRDDPAPRLPLKAHRQGQGHALFVLLRRTRAVLRVHGTVLARGACGLPRGRQSVALADSRRAQKRGSYRLQPQPLPDTQHAAV